MKDIARQLQSAQDPPSLGSRVRTNYPHARNSKMQSLQSSLSAPRLRRFTINSQLTAESTPRRREPILAYDSRRKVGRYAASEVLKNVGIRLERCCELFEHSIQC